MLLWITKATISSRKPALAYQALDDLQQFLHDHRDALVPQQSADGLEMRGSHEVPVGTIDVAVGNVERLEDRGGGNSAADRPAGSCPSGRRDAPS